MKTVALMFAMLVCVGAKGQDLRSRSTLPDKPQPVAQLGQYLVPGEGVMPVIPEGLVMVARKEDRRNVWHIERVNSCFWCGEPMTFKQAAFDKKASAMWLTEIALRVASTEIYMAKCHNGHLSDGHPCGEVNPLLGNSRAQQYGVSMPIIFGAWMGTAYLRKGDKKYRIGGLKPWWILPTVYHAVTVFSIVFDLVR